MASRWHEAAKYVAEEKGPSKGAFGGLSRGASLLVAFATGAKTPKTRREIQEKWAQASVGKGQGTFSKEAAQRRRKKVTPGAVKRKFLSPFEKVQKRAKGG